MRNIRTKSLLKKSPKFSSFYIKTSVFTLIFAAGIFLLNSKGINFLAEISNIQGLLGKDKLLSQAENIKDDSFIRPLKQVTDWSKADNYKLIQQTEWDKLDVSMKTSFPQNLSDIKEKYKYVNPNKIWDSISNPLERDKVIFYKRLMTTTWTASYDWDELWIPDTGTHAGIDLLSSIKTPIYSIANGIVIQKKTPCPGSKCNGFGNYLVIATNYKGTIYATFYAHLDSISSKLSEGKIVKKGDQVAKLGSSGNSTAPHLHLQINKLGSIDEIKDLNIAKQLFEGWFHNLDGVKSKTVDPISFIEGKIKTKSDALTFNDTITDEDNNDLIDNSVIDDIANSIEDNTHTAAPAPKDFRFTKIQASTMQNSLTKGDAITISIYSTGEKGSITITTNNNTIIPSTYSVSSNENNYNEITLLAKNAGNSEIIFNDGENTKTLYYSVYDKEKEVYGLGLEGPDTIFTSTESEYILYPMDKLGNKIYASLQGDFKIVLEDKNTRDQHIIKEFYNNDNITSLSFEIIAPKISNYKLKIFFEGKNKSLMVNKSLSTDMFLDYSVNDKYGVGIKSLYNKSIVKGFQGLLMPNNSLTRMEVVIILIRQKYGDNLSQFRNEMNSYISQNGRFFSDVNGKGTDDPYLFKGFQEGILKGAAGKALPSRTITKGELITLYGRTFGAEIDDNFTYWTDIKDNEEIYWYKSFANAAKKYNLYPFENTKKFNSEQRVSRIFAFESLYRYMSFNPPKQPANTHSSSKDSSDSEDSLEDVVRNLIKF